MADQQQNPQPTPTPQPTDVGHVGGASGSWDSNASELRAPAKPDFSSIAGHIEHLPLDPLGELGDWANEGVRRLERATSYTQEGRAEHPYMAKVGDAIRNVHELVSGGKAAGKPEGTQHGLGEVAGIAAQAAGAPEETAAEATEKIGELGAAIKTRDLDAVKSVLEQWLPKSWAEADAQRLIDQEAIAHEEPKEVSISPEGAVAPRRFDFDHIPGHKSQPPEGQYERVVGTVDPKLFLKTVDQGGPIDRATVDLYREHIRNGTPLDPVQAFRDEDGNLIFADGRHRALAAIEEGIPRIDVETYHRVAPEEEPAETELVGSTSDFQPFKDAPQISLNYTPTPQLLGHELSHFVVGKKLGFDFSDGVSSWAHPLNRPTRTGATNAAVFVKREPWMSSLAKGGLSALEARANPEARTAFATRFAPMVAAGGVGEEVMYNRPLETNPGLFGDRRSFHKYGDQLGFTSDELKEIWSNAQLVAKRLLTEDDSLKTIKSYIDAGQEKGLKPRWLMSGDRMHDLYDEITGVKNERPTYNRDDFYVKPRVKKAIGADIKPIDGSVGGSVRAGIPEAVAAGTGEGAPGDVGSEPQASGGTLQEPLKHEEIAAGAEPLTPEQQLDQQEKERGLVSTALPSGTETAGKRD